MDSRGTIVLSPHSDDAALSVGCILEYNSALHPITIVTIFSRSDFAPLANVADENGASTVRSIEDRNFANLIDCDLIELGYHDAKLRLYSLDIETLFDLDRPIDKDLANEIARSVEEIVSVFNPSTLLCPLGIGGHIDHRTVRRAVKSLHRRPKLTILYYEDQPYAAFGASVDEIDRSGVLWEAHTDLNISGSARLRKMKNLHAAIYASQPAAAKTSELLHTQRYPFHERLWSCKAN